MFSILFGPTFIAVRQNDADTCLAVFQNQSHARLAQKALEFIIFKNHILHSKGFEYKSWETLILPHFFQIGQRRPQKLEYVNMIQTNKISNLTQAQVSYISKLRKTRKMSKIKEKYGSDDEYYSMLK